MCVKLLIPYALKVWDKLASVMKVSQRFNEWVLNIKYRERCADSDAGIGAKVDLKKKKKKEIFLIRFNVHVMRKQRLFSVAEQSAEAVRAVCQILRCTFWKLFFPSGHLSKGDLLLLLFPDSWNSAGGLLMIAALIVVLFYLLSCLYQVIYQCIAVLGFQNPQDLHILRFLSSSFFFFLPPTSYVFVWS